MPQAGDKEMQPAAPEILHATLPDSSRSEVMFAMVYFAVCSGTLLVINKVTIEVVRAPIFILVCQLSFSAIAVKAGDAAGIVKSEPLEWNRVLAFTLVVLGFVACLFCNIKTLQFTNVETFITFRSRWAPGSRSLQLAGHVSRDAALRLGLLSTRAASAAGSGHMQPAFPGVAGVLPLALLRGTNAAPSTSPGLGSSEHMPRPRESTCDTPSKLPGHVPLHRCSASTHGPRPSV
jgi:hypothetical protein